MNAATQTRFLGDTAQVDHLVPLGDIIRPENFAMERERIFRRSWLPVAHRHDFPERGSYRVIEVPLF
ncbi:MAG TPA: hypothetical protein VF175_13210, partial [Lacipirellula sp.]